MSESAPFLTVIFTFDHGKTYVFKPRLDTDERLAEWEKLFDNAKEADSWDIVRLPEEFNYPLGLIVKYSIDPKVIKDFKEAIPKFTSDIGLDEQSIEVEFLFFTNGAGNLILRANLNPTQNKKWTELEQWGEQAASKLAAFADGADGPIQKYLHVLANSEAIEIKGLRNSDSSEGEKPSKLKKLYDGYSILFLPSQIENQALPNEGFQKASYEVPDTQQGMNLHIGWAYTLVSPFSSSFVKSREEIERVFILGSAAWYTLYSVDRYLSRFLTETYIQRRHKQKGHDLETKKRKIRDLAFAYMEAVDNSRPLRWTLSRRHLEILNKLHDVWQTDRFWSTVTEKSALLTQYYEELHEEKTSKQATSFTVAGLAIGLFALTSALADMFILAESTGTWNPLGVVKVLVAVGMVFIALLVSIYFLRDLWLPLWLPLWSKPKGDENKAKQKATVGGQTVHRK